MVHSRVLWGFQCWYESATIDLLATFGNESTVIAALCMYKCQVQYKQQFTYESATIGLSATFWDVSTVFTHTSVRCTQSAVSSNSNISMNQHPPASLQPSKRRERGRGRGEGERWEYNIPHLVCRQCQQGQLISQQLQVSLPSKQVN